MTALTTMFSFLYVHLRYLVILMFGGEFYASSFSGEAYEIALTILESYGKSASDCVFSPGYPILVLFIGIFVLGSVIGLARRLIRG